ncbi:MAG: PstS family phosphate ABC transporter substrate-binding protein [Saccharofermentanales bacterium]
MKKAAIILGSVLIAMVLAVGGLIIYHMQNQEPVGIADKTSNINVMLTRPDHWEKIADDPVIDVSDMAVLDGSTATIPITAELFRQFYDFTDSQIEQRVAFHSTTHSAYLNLIDRQYRLDASHQTSLILVTPPSEEEQQYAEANQVELDLTPIATDGFVFITHKNNPVDTLTVAQIQDIYIGKITNWKQVGGEDLDIKAYQREQNSGSQTAMEQMVMQGKPMLSPIGAKIYFGMGMLVDAVAEFENGPASIGYTYYYYINNLYKNDNIKVIEIDGIAPINANLISGAYPFTTSYYAVIRKDEPLDSPARILRDYLITPQGQDLIAMAGYCKAVN